MKEFFCGIDVGSTAVRAGLIDSNGELLHLESKDIQYHVDEVDDRFITQSSTEISTNLKSCLESLRNEILGDAGRIVSVACSATCSMCVFKKVGDSLEPYSVRRDHGDDDQNIVFWMDSRPTQETKFINKTLADGEVLKYYGGAFIEEMAIPKVKYLIDHIPKEDLPNIVFLDLHTYLNYFLLQGGNFFQNVVIANEESQIGIDGELQGWNTDFLTSIGLSCLTKNNFSALNPHSTSHSSQHDRFFHVPQAGTKIGTLTTGEILSQGVIDSYAGWVGSCGSSFENTLVMVAGTSTCFIIAHKHKEATIKGIWGPFEGIAPEMYVSEGGQSTTGKLIEHLFESHPAFSQLDSNKDIFEQIEREINQLEKVRGKSIHEIAKYLYNYGDLSGNRTPYADSSMRGVFFGESVDVSLVDLTLKYITVLEFLAFQAKQVVGLFKTKEINVDKIFICGSQAKNKRLVQMIADTTGLVVEISVISPDLAGVRGAAILGMAGYKGVSINEVISNQSDFTRIEPIENRDSLVSKILEKKYRIMLDIAERQRLYNSWMDE